MSATGGMLSGIEGRLSHAVIAFLDDEGYPLSVAATSSWTLRTTS